MTVTSSGKDLINLTIDGVGVSVPKGTLVIRAAEEIGIQIPRFCDHPLLEPAGACRQCMVEVATPGPDGTLRPMPKPMTSCTTSVSEGMAVKSQQTSPVAAKAQSGLMELLLINHPLDCPVCDKGGECPLQNQAMSSGRTKSRFEDVKRTYPKPVNISSQVLLDRERCVLCSRCTRFSDQIAGDPFIALVERGALQQIGIYQDKPFESYFSGNTVQICPVGALTGAAYRFRSRPFDLASTQSICEHCASGCATRTDHRRGTVLRRMAANDPAVNEEWNCDKGRWAFTYANGTDRIINPLVRDQEGNLQVASWPEALDAAARGLLAARNAKGVGVLVGGRVSGEDAYAYSKFARIVLQTNDIDFRARPHSVEEADFLASNVVATGPATDGADGAGGSGGSLTYADLEAASTVLLVGFEPEDESPIVFLRLRKGVRRTRTAVFAVAPLKSRGLEKLGGTLISASPGTEAEVLQALAKAAVKGGSDSVATADLAALRAGLGSGNAVILVGERLAGVPGGLSGAAALASSTGARLAWVPRRAGERGALESGALPNLLPGGRPVTEPVARAQVGAAWDVVGLPSKVGRDTSAIIAAAGSGELGGLVVGGVDPADLVGSGDLLDALTRSFVVSLELRESAVTDVADVILPVAAHQEKAGTFVNWEGRVRTFEAALQTNAMSDHRVVDLLAAEMGEFLGVRTLSATRADMRALGPWTGARAAVPTVAVPHVPPLQEGQAVLATWHHLLDSGGMQDGEPFLAGTAPKTRALLSAKTAASIGLAEGETVRVSTDSGAITVPVTIREMADHVIWLPTNSPGSAVRSTLGVDAGAAVSLTKGGAA